MQEIPKKNQYYVVREKAVSEVLLKVVQAKKMLETNRSLSVQEAAELAGISRSSFYRYKDDIFPFHEESRGKIITFMVQLEDKPGLLSSVLQKIAANHGNILTIHQSIPVDGMAMLTLSVQLNPEASHVEDMIEDMEMQAGVHEVRIMGREYG